jgi:hypothetical protein
LNRIRRRFKVVNLPNFGNSALERLTTFRNIGATSFGKSGWDISPADYTDTADIVMLLDVGRATNIGKKQVLLIA